MSEQNTKLEYFGRRTNKILDEVSESRENAIAVFRKYCIFVVDHYQEAGLNGEDAAGVIAGALLCIPEIQNDDDAHNVFDLAFELELPDAHLYDDRTKLWNEMKEIINRWRSES
jgi:hypothetical protein